MAEARSIPDALGDGQRAALTVAQLASLQQESFQLNLQIAAGGLKGDDPVPGHTRPDGSQLTFDERKAELEAAQERLVKAHGGPELEQLAATRAAGGVGM